MEEVRNAMVNINLCEGEIKISGSEEFVEKNMSTVFEFVHNNILKNSNLISKAIEDSSENTEVQELAVQAEIDKYISAGVYHIDSEDGSISILKKVPGRSNAEKAKNIALIVLHIRKEKIQGKEIIPLCEKHNCYDSGNFSSWFKNEKTNIIRKGNGQNWTIELTQPGEEAASKLLEEMVSEKK